MQTTTLELMTGERFTDLTGDVRSFVADAGDGLVTIFLPHATAGVAVFELGAGTEPDLSETIDHVVPRDERWTHQHGSSGHGADHVLPAFIAPSVTIPVVAGEPMLGTWQSIVLVDTNVDNRRRRVHLAFVAG